MAQFRDGRGLTTPPLRLSNAILLRQSAYDLEAVVRRDITAGTDFDIILQSVSE